MVTGLFVLQVLFRYQESRKVITIYSKDDIVQKVKDSYNIAPESLIIFQKYSDSWGEWVDVNQSEICHKDKVNVHIVRENAEKSDQPSTSSSQVCL